MKTLHVGRTALAAALITRIPSVRPAIRPDQAASSGAAIERQIDEIQGTFGVRWEW